VAWREMAQNVNAGIRGFSRTQRRPSCLPLVTKDRQIGSRSAATWCGTRDQTKPLVPCVNPVQFPIEHDGEGNDHIRGSGK
jgi:hypothetical protein